MGGKIGLIRRPVDMGDICMSDKDRRKLCLMVMVESGDLKLTDDSEILGFSYRQVKRIRKRYCEEGDIGLVHRSRGRTIHGETTGSINSPARPRGLPPRPLAQTKTLQRGYF